MALGQRTILRANALCMAAAAFGGLLIDVVGAVSFRGPEGYLIAGAPHAAIGLLTIHASALALALWLWRTESRPGLHLVAAGVHALLGTTSLVFGSNLIAVDFFWSGSITIW